MIIGISGKIASGKTTIRNHLESKYGFVGVSFADPMKALEKIHNSYPENEWLTNIGYITTAVTINFRQAEELKKLLYKCFVSNPVMAGQKNRKLLQEIGTEVGRKFNERIWIDFALKRARFNNRTVIDDVRFKNELEALSSHTVWRISIPSEIQKERILSLYGEGMLKNLYHLSETDLDNSLHLFNNIIDGTLPLEEMLSMVDFLLKERGINET